MNPLPSILIVDDNPHNRLALRTVLKGVKAELQEAGNGFDALTMALEAEYALILLDIQMPEMDGYEVCEQLRAYPKTAETPVIFLTAAYKEDVDKNRGYVAGATDYLAKPIDDHILKSKVEVFLRLYIQKRLLQESEFRWKFAIEGSGDGLWDWNVKDGTVYFSRRWKEMLGYAEDEIGDHMNEWETRIHPDDLATTLACLQNFLEGRTQTYRSEHRERCKDGSYTWILDRGTVVSRSADGKPLRIIGTHADISERKQAEAKLQLAASVFSNAREGIMITDTDATIIDVNDAFTHITSYKREEVLGYNPRVLSSGRHDQDFYEAMWRNLQEKGHWYGEVWNRRKNGEVYAEMLTISPVRDTEGHVQQYVAMFSDITSIKEHEQQLEFIAHYDVLTQLPNRVLLADRLHQAMMQSLRRDRHLAVVFLDLDGFKAINDNHGHEVGDQLLITVAARMKQVMREGDTCARFGGDEFVVVLQDLSHVESSSALLDRLLAAAALPVQIGDLMVQVSASIGVTFYPQSVPVDADQLLRQADQAMYQAKQSGKNRYHIFEAEAGSEAWSPREPGAQKNGIGAE